MRHRYNSCLKPLARQLRSAMTKEERKLWYEFLRTLPIKVHRQFMVGNYILDFYCAKCRTAIEIDGSQHYEEEGKAKDSERDKYLNGLGIKVLRYSNVDVNNNFEGVCMDILIKFGLYKQ